MKINWIRYSLLTVAALSAFGTDPARGLMKIDFTSSDWNTFGDAQVTGAGSANLTTAQSSGGAGQQGNLSGNDPGVTDRFGGTLESDLGFAAADFDQDTGLGFDTEAFEGSGLLSSSIAAEAGQTLVFNWTFLTRDTDLGFGTGDYAFVEIRDSGGTVLALDPDDPLVGIAKDPLSSSSTSLGGTTYNLEASGSFSYTFGTTDTFEVAIGVLDLGSNAATSAFQVSDAELIPLEFSPGTGLLVVGGVIGVLRWRKYRRSRSLND